MADLPAQVNEGNAWWQWPGALQKSSEIRIPGFF
jgi:hypothetical protein